MRGSPDLAHTAAQEGTEGAWSNLSPCVPRRAAMPVQKDGMAAEHTRLALARRRDVRGRQAAEAEAARRLEALRVEDFGQVRPCPSCDLCLSLI